jgi:glutamyl-tRNA synthetase
LTDSDLRELALRWALKNAIEHKGKASAPAVLSKVIGERPELRFQVNELRAIIQGVVEGVNAMSVDEQRKELGEAAPGLLGRKRTAEVKGLPPLPGAAVGQVVTRLAPEPSGYMHLGHAMSFLLNFLYARMYEGKVWLRFEDTDPRKVKESYYESFRSGCKWLGIEWDHEKNNSDSMSSYYKAGEKLIEEGEAYMCTCPVPELRKLRAAGAECAHRSLGKDEVKALWQRMRSDLKEGEGVLRLRGDMASQNYVMRDPILFRIIDQPHPLTDRLFRVWPTYDMAASIEDSTCGLTHVLRSNEFAPRGELQNGIRALLGLSSPTIIEYSRFTFQGTPLAKRKLRPLIEANLVSGWDDPRLPTVEGAIRRGLVPEAIREFTTSYMAFTNTRKEYDWDLLFAVNRKILDPITRRYYFVPRPVPLHVHGAPTLTVSLRNHPDKDLGRRGVPVDDNFYIAGDDVKGLRNGGTIRLKDLYNVAIEEVSAEDVRAEFIGRELVEGVPKIQWVTGENVPVEVLVPGPLFIGEEFNRESLGHVSGLAEKSVADLKAGEIVQFERFGFCRLDSKAKVETFVFVHK